jgi:lipopolysaccharide transport system permease protein
MISKNKIIISSENSASTSFHELKGYFDLLFFMVLRDIKVLYKQTILGFTWAFIRPFITMVIFTFIFGNLAKIPSDNIPYPIFTYSALLPWLYFSSSVVKSTQSLIGGRSMYTKVYFPKIIIPLTPVLSSLADFLISNVILFLMLFYFKIVPSLNLLWFPYLMFIMVINTAGFSFWFSSLSVQYRDVKHAINFVSQLLMYAAPVVWPISLLIEKFGENFIYFYSIYPMVGIIEGFRSSIIPTNEFPILLVFISSLSSFFIFISGFYYFCKKDKYFADIS